MRRDYVNAAILWFVLTFIAELLLPNLPLPIAAAQEAEVSDESFRLLMVLGVPVFTFVVAVMAYSLYKFRAQGDTLENGAPIRGNTWLSGFWLAITGGLCLLVIVHPGLTGIAKFQQGNPQAQLFVKATGRQWVWDVDYPEQGITHAEELVLPVGQRVKFEVTSSDVLHSFWIPAFRVKVDAAPGVVTTMYVTPKKEGSFDKDSTLRVQCNEICGVGHTQMILPVRVVMPAEFDAWVKSQAAPTDPVKRGEILARAQGCAACHSIDGRTIVGPTWLNLYGSTVTFEDGTTAKADDAYLRQFIINPDFKIIKGFQKGVMPPTFGKTLTPDQINDLIAYIKSVSK